VLRLAWYTADSIRFENESDGRFDPIFDSNEKTIRRSLILTPGLTCVGIAVPENWWPFKSTSLFHTLDKTPFWLLMRWLRSMTWPTLWDGVQKIINTAVSGGSELKWFVVVAACWIRLPVTQLPGVYTSYLKVCSLSLLPNRHNHSKFWENWNQNGEEVNSPKVKMPRLLKVKTFQVLAFGF